jgi:hypothetical protein
MSKQKARALLEEAEHLLKTEAFMECTVAERCEECVTQALAVLAKKPECKTCGDSKVVHAADFQQGITDPSTKPCPDCQKTAPITVINMQSRPDPKDARSCKSPCKAAKMGRMNEYE